jgi:hypothetical protein
MTVLRRPLWDGRNWWADWECERDPWWRVTKLRAQLRHDYQRYYGLTIKRDRLHVRGYDELVEDVNRMLTGLDAAMVYAERHLVEAIKDLRPYEDLEELLDEYAPRVSKCACVFHVMQRTNPQAAYRAYLQSPEWARRRDQVVARSGGQCERCHSARGRDVHHQSYVAVFHEPIDDLWHVCRRCHEELTPHGIPARRPPRTARAHRRPRSRVPQQHRPRAGAAAGTGTPTLTCLVPGCGHHTPCPWHVETIEL